MSQGDESSATPQDIAPAIRRVLAYVLDVAVLAAAVMAVQHGARLAFGWPPEDWLAGARFYWFVSLPTVSVPVWLYFALFESGRAQATPMKRLLGMQVTDGAGHRIGFGRALLRTAIKLLPWELVHGALFLPVPFWNDPDQALMRPVFTLAVFLMGSWLVTLLLTPKTQGVHDLVAGTLVVRR
jgi:uncharacterized RDD family membrane protein YckC